jgi:AcrR family transcriptional regulator
VYSPVLLRTVVKSKTEAKRQEILKAAAEVFREVGYERATMSDIRARIGGSKATLYNYFPSKESLLLEVMHHSRELELQAVVAALDPEAEDLRKELLRFGQEFLAVLYSPETIATRRLSIAESRHTEIGRVSFERAILPTEKRVAEFLRAAMKRGALRTADPKIAAMHCLSLLESELLQRMLLGVMEVVKPEALAGAARRAVAAFLSGYAPASGARS